MVSSPRGHYFLLLTKIKNIQNVFNFVYKWVEKVVYLFFLEIAGKSAEREGEREREKGGGETGREREGD